jgi:hypothetical protein
MRCVFGFACLLMMAQGGAAAEPVRQPPGMAFVPMNAAIQADKDAVAKPRLQAPDSPNTHHT